MAELLRVEGLRAGYGEAVVIQGLGFALDEGQSLAVLGRNGTGKTTLLNTLVGVTRRFSGRIVLAGQDLARLPAHARVAAGIGWVPQERNIFKSLTAHENSAPSPGRGRGRWSASTGCFRAFASARRNMGHQLSGGEQQMLAVARALVLNPEAAAARRAARRGWRRSSSRSFSRPSPASSRGKAMSAIIVEQSPRLVLPITQRAMCSIGAASFMKAAAPIC
jgi:branched-chain amino acid transport system ATP-binding protein